jgi:hypothetical protein
MINESKTKYTVAANTQNCSKTRAIEIGRYNFEKTDSFAYLGSLLNGENNVSEEVTNRLIAANNHILIFWTKKSVKSPLL